MNLIEVIIAILFTGIVYTAAKVGTYLLLTRIDINNLDKLWDKLPNFLQKTAKYLGSKKFKKTAKEFQNALESLMMEDDTTVEPESTEEE